MKMFKTTNNMAFPVQTAQGPGCLVLTVIGIWRIFMIVIVEQSFPLI